jgi:hypothetical protein
MFMNECCTGMNVSIVQKNKYKKKGIRPPNLKKREMEPQTNSSSTQYDGCVCLQEYGGGGPRVRHQPRHVAHPGQPRGQTPEIISVLRIRDVYPDFYSSRIPDLGSRIQKQQQKRGVEKNVLSYLFCSHKFYKIEYYFIFEVLKKKIWASFQRLTQKFVTNL